MHLSNEFSALHSLHAVRQEIQSLSVQLEKGFIDLAGEPAKSSDGFRDTLDACGRLLTKGARVVCIGESGVGKSCLINCMVHARMQSATEYEQANMPNGSEAQSEITERLHKHTLHGTDGDPIPFDEFVGQSSKVQGFPVEPHSYDGYLLPEGNLGNATHIAFELCYGKTWGVTVEYEFEEEVAQYLRFLRKELAEFQGISDDDEDLDTEKENSKQRAFAIVGKGSGTSLHDISFDDIKIPQAVRERLGRRITYTDTSGSFADGLAYVRNIILSVSTDPYWGIVKYVTVHIPCELLQSGGRLVDSPCVADIDITRSQLLCEWLKESSAVVLVLSVSPLSHPLIMFLEKYGCFENLLEDKTKMLAVIVPGDKFTKFMDKEKREEWENRHKKEKMDILRKSLVKCSRAQEKRNAVNSLMEDSSRFKFLHFYRCWTQEGLLSWEDARMDQITNLFEQGFSRQVKENLAESVTRIVEGVIDLASGNIDEVLHWNRLRTRPDFNSICSSAQHIVDTQKKQAELLLPEVLECLESLKSFWNKELTDHIRTDIALCTPSECEKRINELVYANKSSDRMVMGALARHGKYQTTTMEQLMVGPIFDHLFSHIKNTLSIVNLDDPNATTLNHLWQLFSSHVSLPEASDDVFPGYRVVQLCIEEVLSGLKMRIRNKLGLEDLFSSVVVDQSLQAALHAKLYSLFQSQLAVFNSEDIQKHSNRTNERKSFLVQNCVTLAENSIGCILEIFAPVFTKAIDRVSKLFMQVPQTLEDTQKLFGVNSGSKLEENVLRILYQRQLALQQIKLNMINAVPWKDFEGVRQKAAQAILQLGMESKVSDLGVTSTSTAPDTSCQEIDILFREISSTWAEKAEEGQITWKWVETQATSFGLAERIANCMRASIRGCQKTPEDILNFIQGRRLTYGDLPEDFQDAKDDMLLLQSGDSNDLLTGLRKREHPLFMRRKFALSNTYNNRSKHIQAIMDDCAKFGGISVPPMGSDSADVKLVAVNPCALQYMYDSPTDLGNLLALKARPDVRFLPLVCLRDFLETGELNRSKEIFSSGGIVVVQEGTNIDISAVKKLIANTENWYLQILDSGREDSQPQQNQPQQNQPQQIQKPQQSPQSTQFQPTPEFQQTPQFHQTMQFSQTQQFAQPQQSHQTQQYHQDQQFQSEQFSQSEHFPQTDQFSHPEQFSQAQQFSQDQPFSQAQQFSQAQPFQPTQQFCELPQSSNPAQMQGGCGCGCGPNGPACTCNLTLDENAAHPISVPSSPNSAFASAYNANSAFNSNSPPPSPPLSTSQSIVAPGAPSPALNKLGPSKSHALRYDGEWLEMGRLDGESDDEFVVRCCVNISVTNPTLRHIVLLTSSPTLNKKAEAKKILCVDVEGLSNFLSQQAHRQVDSPIIRKSPLAPDYAPTHPSRKRSAGMRRSLGETTNTISYNGSCHCCRNRKPAEQLVPCSRTREFLNHKQKCRRVFCFQCLKTHYNVAVDKLDRDTWVCPPCNHSCKCYQCVPLKRSTPKKQKLHIDTDQTTMSTQSNPPYHISPHTTLTTPSHPQMVAPMPQEYHPHIFVDPHHPAAIQVLHNSQILQNPQPQHPHNPPNPIQISPAQQIPHVQNFENAQNAQNIQNSHSHAPSPSHILQMPQTSQISPATQISPSPQMPQFSSNNHATFSTHPMPHSAFSMKIAPPTYPHPSFNLPPSPSYVLPQPERSSISTYPMFRSSLSPSPSSSLASNNNSNNNNNNNNIPLSISHSSSPTHSREPSPAHENLLTFLTQSPTPLPSTSMVSSSPSSLSSSTIMLRSNSPAQQPLSSSQTITSTQPLSSSQLSSGQISSSQISAGQISSGQISTSQLSAQLSSSHLSSDQLSSAPLASSQNMNSNQPVFSINKRRNDDDEDGEFSTKRIKKNGVVHISIKDLMESGYITAGEKIQFVFRNTRHEAFITPEGKIHTGEKQFPTPTAWTNATSGHSTSGWGLIKIAATGEKLLTLKDKFLAQLASKERANKQSGNVQM
eukprot:Phypoly_transcript_00180.p1 GENE.Phypoly_transcript_00180~~Phypoly_transcript_00180.p1  ORF type:complete len:1997 (+),score=348.40 Phypoly_transcript_00180:137-6127(+)